MHVLRPQRASKEQQESLSHYDGEIVIIYALDPKPERDGMLLTFLSLT